MSRPQILLTCLCTRQGAPCFPAGSPQGWQEGNGPPTSPRGRPARASLRAGGQVRTPRPTPVSADVRFLCKSCETAPLPTAFSVPEPMPLAPLPSSPLWGVPVSPQNAGPFTLSSPVFQKPFPPAIPSALTSPRLHWERPNLQMLSAEHVDVPAKMFPSRMEKSRLNKRMRLAELPRDWGHHLFFSGKGATDDKSWVPVAGWCMVRGHGGARVRGKLSL